MFYKLILFLFGLFLFPAATLAVSGDLVWSQTGSMVSGGAAMGVAVDVSGIYVVGTNNTSSSGNRYWRVKKLSLGTGEEIWDQYSDHGRAYDVAV